MRSSRLVCRLASQVMVALAAAACSDPVGRADILVRAALVRLPGGSQSGLSVLTPIGIEANPAVIPWTSQVSVSSVRSPVTEIRLVGAGGSRVSLYTCAASSAAACLVELNGPELQNLLGTSPVAVAIGTYDHVEVTYCTSASTTGRQVFLVATATIGGTTQYTRTAGTLGTTGPAEPVAIDYAGCATSYPISPPLVISDSMTATTEVRLYFDTFDIASAVLPSAQASSIFVGGPCTARPSPSTSSFVCLSYPEPIAVVGTTPPLLEHYRVNGGATVGLVFDAGTDAFYGGYLRRFLVEDQPWTPGFNPDPPIGTLTMNTDGTYRMTVVPDIHGTPGPVFPAWRRATHSGTISFTGGTTTPYSAVRLP